MKTVNQRAKKSLKTLNTIFESLDTFFSIGATSTSIALSITGTNLTFLPISAGIACALSLSNKVLHEMIINIYKKYQKLYQKDQKTKKSFDKLYRKNLEENLINGNDYKPLFNIFTKYLDETKKKKLFQKIERENEIKAF